MPQKLETVLKNVDELGNDVNRKLIHEYHRYLISRDTGTNYQKDNVKLVHMFAKFLGQYKTFNDIRDSQTIVESEDIVYRESNKIVSDTKRVVIASSIKV